MNTSAPQKRPVRVWYWSDYFISRYGKGPSPLAKWILPYLGRKERGLEIGCGSCDDSRFLLEQGVEKIDAYDCDPSFVVFGEELRMEKPGRFSPVRAFVQDLVLATDVYDLAYANLALPYHGYPGFWDSIEMILGSLRKDGIFAATFLGESDWTRRTYPEVVRVTREELIQALQGFDARIVSRRRLHPEGDQHSYIVIAKKT